MKRLTKISEKQLSKDEIFKILVEVMNGELKVINDCENFDFESELKSEEDCREVCQNAIAIKYDYEEFALAYLTAQLHIEGHEDFLRRCLNRGKFNYYMYALNEALDDDNSIIIQDGDYFILIQVG